MNQFIVCDTNLCIGCRTCEITCVLSHVEGEQMAAVDLSNFHPRLHLIKDNEVSGVVMCRHCEDAPCASVCPNDAIIHCENSIQVLQDKCIGCKTCELACPYGVISVEKYATARVVNGEKKGFATKAVAFKCDLCKDRTNGQGSACVEVCPTKALHVFDSIQMQEIKKKRQHAALSQQQQAVAG